MSVTHLSESEAEFSDVFVPSQTMMAVQEIDGLVVCFRIYEPRENVNLDSADMASTKIVLDRAQIDELIALLERSRERLA